MTDENVRSLPFAYINRVRARLVHPQLIEWVEEGKTVVQAVRPVEGEEVWTGYWGGLKHFAVGQLADYFDDWQMLGAVELKLIDNRSIVNEMAQLLTQYPYNRLYPNGLKDVRRETFLQACANCKPPLPFCDRPEIDLEELQQQLGRGGNGDKDENGNGELIQLSSLLDYYQQKELNEFGEYDWTEFAVSLEDRVRQACMKLNCDVQI